MTAKFFAILTNQGAARLANATVLGTKLNLTQLAVGDGGGTLPTPDPAQTALLGEKRRAALNLLSVDPTNSSQIIAEQIIPENEGGFWIREIGLYDDAGVLVAVANCPETYKPQLQEGSGRTQTIRMVLIVSSTAAVTLKIDPSVVLATRKYVDDRVIEVKAYADNLLAQHLAAVDPHPQYAPKNSPALTGRPTAPTAAQTENSTQLATTGFVKAALAALVASSPEQLDTLNELAAALGNDANFATTMTAALAGKQPLNATLSALAGKDVAGLLQFLGLGNLGSASGRDVGNTQSFHIPDMSYFELTGKGTDNLLAKGPSGLILQVFRRRLANSTSIGMPTTIPVTYPTPFPNNIWGVFCTKATYAQVVTSCETATASGFDAVTCLTSGTSPGSNLSDVYFLAIGY